MVRERADRNSGSAPVPTSTSLSVAELRQLITLMEKSDIEEITIEHESDGLHLTLRKPAPLDLDPAVLLGASELLESGATVASEPAPEAEAEAVKALDIRSTLVGFYRAVARRGAKPLAPGDSVKEGQIIGAVEALNVLNEVESPAAGRVRTILVDDGQPVQYGQVLMKVEPLKV
ncbi:MAG TPA: acetyl-CoA carboxylase biotin carboxyl carrier protein subunit [Ktedonobacterales bacterium]|jgi:biotin carboxyl carrier protein